MEALGMIETKGLLAAIESADAMLKAAEVRLLDRTFTGGGLVTITITGDVAAVKASVDAAAAAVSRLGAELLLSRHVIPRPHSELGETILPLAERCKEQPEEPEEDTAADKDAAELPKEAVSEQAATEEPKEPEPATEDVLQMQADDMHKEDMEQLVARVGVEQAVETLEKCKVGKLRNLAREYEDFGIAGGLISKANKSALLEEFRKYYS